MGVFIVSKFFPEKKKTRRDTSDRESMIGAKQTISHNVKPGHKHGLTAWLHNHPGLFMKARVFNKLQATQAIHWHTIVPRRQLSDPFLGYRNSH